MRYAFTGMDKALHTTKERRNTNTIFMHLSTDPSIGDEFLLKRLLSRVERCLHDPKSPLRARFAEEDADNAIKMATAAKSFDPAAVDRIPCYKGWRSLSKGIAKAETGTTGAATGVTIDAAGCSLTILSNSLNASPERFLISLVVFMMFLEPIGNATNT